MTKMTMTAPIAAATAALLFAWLPAWAAPTTLRTQVGDWTIRFDAPALTQRSKDDTRSHYRYAGSADRFNRSLYIEPPNCPGGATLDDEIRCFLGRIERLPGLVKQSIRANAIARGAQVSYVVYAPVGDTMVKMMHTYLLFADAGTWGDLHASVIRPTVDEIAMLVPFGDAFDYTAPSTPAEP